MATAKFTEESPYQMAKRIQHRTDFKYSRYITTKEINNDKDTDGPKRFNVALIGAGRAGTIHLWNIRSNPRLHLRYIVEADSSIALKIKREFDLHNSAILSPDEVDTAFKDESIHGVIIASPTFTHEKYVIAALKAGKTVLCEKPIGQDEERTRLCYKVSQETGARLLCAFNRRFEPSFREAYEQVRGGIVGRVHIIKTVSRDSPLPPIDYIKTSGGIFHDCGVHDIDLICWILGEYPDKVAAMTTSFIPEIGNLGDRDTVAITLHFPSGTLGMIDLSRNAVYGYDQRLEVFGPKGMVIVSNDKPMAIYFSGESCTSQPPIYHSFPSRYYEGYLQELNHFCDIMEGIAQPLVTCEHTLKISKIASALEESARNGKFVEIK